MPNFNPTLVTAAPGQDIVTEALKLTHRGAGADVDVGDCGDGADADVGDDAAHLGFEMEADKSAELAAQGVCASAFMKTHAYVGFSPVSQSLSLADTGTKRRGQCRCG